MFINASPFTFLFSTIYFVLLCLLPSISDFYMFWVVIELLMLIFIGICYTCFLNSISSLISYFLIQSVASFYILLSFVLSSPVLFSFSFILKIGGFPLSAWFISCVVVFPPFPLFLACSFHKLPILVLISQFSLTLPRRVFWGFVCLNTLFTGLFLVTTLDLRYFLVGSSIANNSWLLLRQSGGVFCIVLFIATYFPILFWTLFRIGTSAKLNPYFTNSNLILLFAQLIALSGLPPSPLFISKLLILFSLPTISSTVLLFLIFSSLAVCSYFIFLMRYLISHYGYACKR